MLGNPPWLQLVWGTVYVYEMETRELSYFEQGRKAAAAAPWGAGLQQLLAACTAVFLPPALACRAHVKAIRVIAMALHRESRAGNVCFRPLALLLCTTASSTQPSRSRLTQSRSIYHTV